MRRGFVALGLTALLSVGCTVTNPYYDPQKSHHTVDGFKNNYLTESIGGSFLRWQYDRITQGLPKPPENHYAFPVVQPDLQWLQQNRAHTSATWIGHATVLMQVRGVNLITDPVFSHRVSPVSFVGPQRKVALPMAITDLPHIDVVLISHNHYDHLDKESVSQLNRQLGGPPLFLVPLGIKPWMANLGITNVRELDWWQHADVSGLTLHFVPVQHWSARGLTDRFQTLWGGWMVRTASAAATATAVATAATVSTATPPSITTKPFSFFFAGDTGYSKDFADIHQRFDHFDLALLPIGAYTPRWFLQKQHVDPAEAVKIHRDLQARQSIAIHWGTFELTDEPLDAPPLALAAELQKAGIPAADFAVLRHGELRRFENK